MNEGASPTRYERARINPSEVEEAVRAIWGRELGCAAPARTDEFFRSGGDSLRAMRLLAALEQCFGVEVPVLVFAKPVSIASLSTEVHALLGQDGASPELTRECGEI